VQVNKKISPLQCVQCKISKVEQQNKILSYTYKEKGNEKVDNLSCLNNTGH